MAAQLRQVREPAAAHRGIRNVAQSAVADRQRTRRSRPAERTPTEPRGQEIPRGSLSAPGPRPPSTPSDDGRDVGLSLLLSFLAAVLLMVGAVVAIGIVDRSWILVPVMVVDLAVTFCVLAAIAHLLRDDDGSG
jgi:hypothetical protein